MTNPENERPENKAAPAIEQDTMKQSAVAAFKAFVEPVIRRPDFVQTGALCLREGKSGTEVLLVSSLTSKRWIVPKGWPIEGLSLADAALQEAWEEAGVKGTVTGTAVGSFGYQKVVKKGIPVSCRCELFRVNVTALADDWPEKDRRQRRWVTPAEAADSVDEPELKALLRTL